MNYGNLDEFKEELVSMENFFTEFAARENELLAFGMSRVSDWESYIASAMHLKCFEMRIHEFQTFLRPIDKQLYERVTHLAEETNIAESITGIEVSLRIATQRKQLNFSQEIVSSVMFNIPYFSNWFKRKRLFTEDVIPIQKLLVSIGRLISLVSLAKDSYISKWYHDSDVFKPSNLDHEKIIAQIETAIAKVDSGISLNKEDKKQLKAYLYKAKSEFSEDRPSWNKIIGALVIAAAITSGIADSTGAYENIDTAIKYILGTSIEKYAPSPVPLIDKSNPKVIASKKDRLEAETGV
ncbi:hypothetical protein LRP52_32260 [Photobacterium sp. ZSDE20]|uniref:Uncharacterized protein n=1 Tax=Photobacterium pectinilyticum TaxID=2906793 RepID=A0ABT1N5H6_9GAMM|nr:hypothetical protein [Photobacterium sp. ZSDE20]MCQ1060000.1 hypothetical protein [Photobacterium sp. ZSDE20]MDD1826862.1 hypothetical protein [Photobacterium sp. ZSDE20]